AVAIAMANQAAARHVRPARPRFCGIRGLGLGAHQWLPGRAGPATARWKSRRAGERALRYLAGQSEVVLLQINDAFMAREIFQGVLELTRLAGPQAELHHQLAKPKRLARLALENLENLLRRWKFAHMRTQTILSSAGGPCDLVVVGQFDLEAALCQI